MCVYVCVCVCVRAYIPSLLARCGVVQCGMITHPSPPSSTHPTTHTTHTHAQVLKKPLELRDLRDLDETTYNSLKWFLTATEEEIDLMEQTFVASYDEFGEVKEVELCPGGADRVVTMENREEFVRLATRSRITRGRTEQMDAFLKGFDEILPLEHMQVFDERELDILLQGLAEFDVADWKANTLYRNYTKDSKQIKWFWQLVESLTDESRARLLQFVTGYVAMI